VNTSISSLIFVSHYAPLAKNKMKGRPWRFPAFGRFRSAPHAFTFFSALPVWERDEPACFQIRAPSLPLRDRDCIARFIFCHEYLAELIERCPFDFRTRAIHQVQIKMQVVQRD